MNKNKKYIFIGSLVLVILIIGFLNINSNKKKVLDITTDNQKTEIKTGLINKTQTEIPIQKNNKKETPQVPFNENNIKVSLVVEDKKYDTNINEDSSVFDAMEKIEKESLNNNIFNFKYTNNASLGNFVTEINGREGTSGKYWIYYVNNKKASVGVSNYFLREGDIIKWSQEGI